MVLEKYINTLLSKTGLAEEAPTLGPALTIVAIGIVAVLSYVAFRRIVEPFVRFLVAKSPTRWDDDFFTDEVLRGFAQLCPALVVNWLLPNLFAAHAAAYQFTEKATDIYIVWACVYLVSKIIHSLFTAFEKRKNERINSMKGIFQMCRLIVVGVGVIITAAILFNRSPVAILTAFGASAAVLMLVFRDTILGLVAGVQLTANRMLHKGDWIICEKAGANGEVVDISLTTVKVRNWDNSIVTIPPYNLISDSFQNYQPMRRSGGRRVSRSIYIDVNSVRFLSDDELAALKADGLVESTADGSVNLGLLRRHLQHWLSEQPVVVGKRTRTMFVMVRQLQSTPQGIPLELYFFTSVTDWASYEAVQSDIFDYVYAVVPRFGLRIFQAPSGLDVASLTR